MEAVDYERKKEGNRTEGAEYQSNLTITTWLRADKIYRENYQILPEWVLAGNLDDVVLKYKNENEVHYRFLQAKHVSNEAQTLTFDQLFNKKEFKIEKYFESYQDFHKNFKDGKIYDLILFTNLALNENVEPYVTALPADDPIFQFQQKEENGKTPIMHKLSENFIDKYKNKYDEEDKLRRIVKAFMKCCVNGAEVKQSDEFFEGCKFLITQEIANVEGRKLHSNFIEGKGLSEGTEQFREIFLKESATGGKTCLSLEAERGYLANVKLKFPPGFGKSDRHKKTKDWPIWTKQKEELFREFCGLFKLATSQPNERELIKYIEAECEKKRRHPNSATERLKTEIRDWYNNNKVPFKLDSISLKRIMSRTDPDEMGGTFIEQTKRNIEELSALKLKFKIIPYEDELKLFLQQSEKNEFHLTTKGSVKVSLLKLFNCLERLQQTDYLFCPKAEISQIDKFSEVFRDSDVFKILVCEIQSVEINQKFKKKLKPLTDKNKGMKIILVNMFTNGEEKTIEDLTQFQDLTAETQKELLERKISFQGADIAFNSIYGKEIPAHHQDIESWGILLDKQIEINNTSGKFDSTCYINRTLAVDLPYFNKDTIQQELGDQHIITYNNYDFHEQIKRHPTKNVHELFNLKELWCWRRSNGGIKELLEFKKGAEHLEYAENTLCETSGVFVISDMAGYGKTTTTLFLADELQKQHPNCCITRLQPSQLCFVPEEILWSEADISKYEAFLMEKLFKLTTPLERIIFKQYLEDEESKSQLVFIFDGFDEIDEDHQKVIIEALKYLKLKRNVKFVGITTRPQYEVQLEEGLQTVAYKLLPFNHENKITFLVNFWLSRGVKGQNERLRECSERLIRLISKSISDEESKLTGIPLQMRMIGEIYKDDAVEYLTGDLEEKEIVAVDLFGLYEQFIRRKEDVYLYDKVGANASTAQRNIILKPFRKIQTEFAVKVIMGVDYRDLKDQLKDSIGLGIIQLNQGGYSFIHRTFAEFLAAKYFLDYTLSVLTKVNNGELMRVMYKRNSFVVRKFINSKLAYEEMASELKKPEYREAILNIKHQQFEDAMIRSMDEETNQILYFLLEFYWYFHPEVMKRYIPRQLVRRIIFHPYFSLRKGSLSIVDHWMTNEWSTSDPDAFLDTFRTLLPFVFERQAPAFTVFASKIVNDLQDKLEEREILSEEGLKSILFEISFDSGIRSRVIGWDELTIGYLKHLKMKHERLFYSFLREKYRFVQVIITKEGNEFYELMGETDASLVYDVLVESGLEQFACESTFDMPCFIKLEPYLKYLSNYMGRFIDQQIQQFKKRLLEYVLLGSYEKIKSISKGRILFEFIRKHFGIESVDEVMEGIKIQKNLSFIENCALWGWTDVLEFVLNAGDIEVDIVEKLQLSRFDSLGTNKERILISIREYSDEKLMETARAFSQFYSSEVVKLPKDSDGLEIIYEEFHNNMDISWITTEELFIALIEFIAFNKYSMMFAIERFPQYKMRFFEIRKNDFTKCSPSEIEIVKNDDRINKEEFLQLLQFRDDDGYTILLLICTNFWELRDWLRVMKRKCTSDDIVELFRMSDVMGRTVFHMINDKSMFTNVNHQNKCKLELYRFINELDLVEFKNEIEFSLEETAVES